MSLLDHSIKYYLDQKKNCSVSMLLGANDYYNLNLGEEDYKLLVGFGGGIGCGYICGCLAGSVAVLGKMFSSREDFRPLCAKFVALFNAELGSNNCADIMKTCFCKDRRCAVAVEKTAVLLERYIEGIK